MRRVILLLLVSSPVLFGQGCAWFVIGGAAGLVMLTQQEEEPNDPPALAVDNPERLKTSPGVVYYRLFDSEGDSCSISVEVSLAGGPFQPATQGAGGDGTSGLSASPAGTQHSFSWDFASDLTSAEQSVRLRFLVSDQAGAGPGDETADFFAGNVPPEITAIELPSGEVTGTATMEITISDTQSDAARIQVQFLRSTDGGDWDGLGAAAAPDASPPELATHNLATLPAGKQHLYPWDSDASGNLPGENAMALIRARASEDGVSWGSWFAATGTIDIRNDHAPRCEIPSLRLHQDGMVFVPYTVSDEESHVVSIAAEYRPFGESAWRRASAGFGTTPLSFAASPSGVTGVFVWDSVKDRAYGKSVTIRLTPSQQGLLGEASERDVLVGNDGTQAWHQAASMPTARHWFACAGSGGRIFAIGGRSPSTLQSLSTVEAYEPWSDSWSARSPMPAAAHGVCAAVLAGRIHVLGGGSATHSVYDPSSDSWTTLTSMPEPRQYPAAAFANGMLYVTGGTDGVGTTRDTLYAYDPVTDSWTAGAAMPAALMQHASAGLGGQVYAAAGITSFSSLKTLYRYDPSTNSWTTLASMTNGRHNLGLAVVAGKLVATGGSYDTGINPTAYLSSAEEYDPFLNSWRSLPAMTASMGRGAAAAWNGKIYALGSPDNSVFDAWRETSYGRANLTSTDREGIASAEAGGSIYLFGGRAFTNFFTTVESYNPLTNGYTARAALSPARGHASAALLNGLVYVTGGETADQVEIATVSRYNRTTNTWSAGVALPSKRSRHGCVSMGGRLWCAGGRYWDGSAYQAMSELTSFDPTSGAWTQKAPMPAARYGAGCAALGGILYVAGGEDASGNPVSSLFAYDPSADSWTSKAGLPQALSDPGLTVAGGRLILMGGTPGSNTIAAVSIYDPETDAWAQGPSMPSGHSRTQAASWNGRAFVFGGFVDLSQYGWMGHTNSTATHDPARQHLFANERDLPEAVAGAAAFVLDGRLHVVGGLTAAEAATTTHRVLELAGDVADSQPFELGAPWGAAAALPSAVRGAAALVANGVAYVIGGLDALGNGVGTFLKYDPSTDTWIALPSMNYQRGYLGFASASGLLYAFGGEDGGNRIDRVEAFDPVAQAWVSPAPASMSASRSMFCFAALEGRLYAFGGKGASGAAISSCERYDPDNDSWTAIPALDKPVTGAVCIEEGGVLRMFGGEIMESASVSATTDRIRIFDPVNGTWRTDEEAYLPYRGRDLFGASGSASFSHRGTAAVRRVSFVGGGIEGTSVKSGVYRFYTRR